MLLARWGFHALGAIGGLLAVSYLFVVRVTLGNLLETFIIAALASTLLYSGLDAARGELSINGRLQAVFQTVLIGLSFTLLAFAVSTIWQLEDTQRVRTTFMLAFALVLGLSVGARLSLHAARAREELDRLDELVKLLTISQRVLRHNVRNELAIVSAHLDNLDDRYPSDDADLAGAYEHLDELVATSRRAQHLVDIWERDALVEREIGAIVDEAVDRFAERFPDAEVDVTLPGRASVVGHPALVEAVEEALVNAIEHNDDDVTVSITVSDASPSSVSVVVADTGCGIDESERVVLDQSGETPLSHGVGLGLWLIYWIVAKSGGELSIGENAQSGTIVEMRLPRATNGSLRAAKSLS